MGQQWIAGIISLIVSCGPLGGLERVALKGLGIRPPGESQVGIHALHRVKDPDVRFGPEAVRLAMEGVIEAMTEECYRRYGGLFVSRSFVKRRILKEVGRHEDQIQSFIQRKYLSDNVPVRFNRRTAEVTYSERHCLRTETIRQIATALIELHLKKQDG